MLKVLKHASHMDWTNENTFSSQGIFNRLENWGNFTQKYWKTEGILASFIFIIFFSVIFNWSVFEFCIY